MKRWPIQSDVPGAPFVIGACVRVIQLTDETACPQHLGRSGVVVHFEYDCGCGQRFPDDPMIGVRMEDGTTDEFWAEELALTASTRRLVRGGTGQGKRDGEDDDDD